jgi:Cys-rich repeat protein
MALPRPRKDRQDLPPREARWATAVAGCAVLVLAAACGTRDDPNTCIQDTDCGGGVCNQISHTCQRRPTGTPSEGGGGGGGPRGGNGGTTPMPPIDPNTDGGTPPPGQPVPPDVDASDPPPPPDAPPDTPPDAANSCSDNSHCPTDKGQCFELQCVACTMDNHCTGEKRKCTESKTCVECLANSDCTSGTRPFCTSNVCVECQAHADCKTAERPLCSAGACVKCEDGGDDAGCAQKDSDLPICLSSGECAECGVSTDCKADNAPICEDNECVPCTQDAQCAERDQDQPGICLFPRGGRCVKNEETIYVQGASPCANSAGQGTSAAPFCDPQRAVAAVTPTRRVIRIRGPQAVGDLQIDASGPQITIIGQEGATVTSPAGVGIQIDSGNIHIRGLRVSGNQTGIVVDQGATLQLNRALVDLNREGGLQIDDGVTFDISNSVFAKNGLGSVGAIRYAGVFLGTPGGGRTGRFRGNTVVSNDEAGVVCNSTSQALVGVLLQDNVGLNWFNCATPTGREGVDPRFSAMRPYHLTEGSPCQDAMASGDMPPDDFDGEPRPYPLNGRSDCGADEYRPSP